LSKGLQADAAEHESHASAPDQGDFGKCHISSPVCRLDELAGTRLPS
jgi:hypothetical protein